MTRADLITALTALLLAACGPDLQTHHAASTAISCVQSSDCDPGGSCVDAFCVTASSVCESDNDCPSDQTCQGGGCGIPTLAGCTADIDCASGQSCQGWACIGVPTTPASCDPSDPSCGSQSPPGVDDPTDPSTDPSSDPGTDPGTDPSTDPGSDDGTGSGSRAVGHHHRDVARTLVPPSPAFAL